MVVTEKERVILIAASGTGGHLLPALEIARALERRSEFRIECVGTDRPLERKLIGDAGYTRHIIQTSGLVGTGVRGVLRALLVWPRGFLQVWRLLSTLQPAAVVGVGGYASVLPVSIAALRGIPTWIHEAERSPGWANRFLRFFARGISGAYADTRILGRSVVHTGQPVRQAVLGVPPVSLQGQAPKNLLVLGGSQGARAVDEVMQANLPLLKERGVEVRHQCRPENVETLTAAYQAADVPAQVVPFIDDMCEAYSWSHIILGRAGAGAVLEVGVVNRPAIFIPLAIAQGGHQKENAMRLVTHGKALVVEEGPECARQVGEALRTLLDTTEYHRYLNRPYPERRTDAAERIAEEVLAMVG